MRDGSSCKKPWRTILLGAVVITVSLFVWSAHHRKAAIKPTPDEAWESYANAAYEALDAEHHAEAERTARLALAQCKRFTEFDDRRAESLNLVGRACDDQGKYKAAVAYYLKAISEYRRSPAYDKEHIADVMANLGNVYRQQGKVDDAMRTFTEMDALDNDSVTPNDIRRVRHLSDKALLMMHLERYAEARAVLARVDAIYRANPDRDKGAEGANLKVIAMTYASERKYAKAERIYEQAIPLLTVGHGADSPSVARAMEMLANVLNCEGKLAKAEPLYVRAMSIFQKRLGPRNLYLGGTMDDYAILLKKMHRYKEAAAYRAKTAAIPAERSMAP